MPRAKIRGYHWRQDIVKARNANRSIRQIIQKLLDERPGSQTYNFLLTRIALLTGESDDALQEIARISENTKE